MQQKIDFLKLLPPPEKRYLKWWLWILIEALLIVSLFIIYVGIRVGATDNVALYSQLSREQQLSARKLVELEKEFGVKKDKVVSEEAQLLANEINDKAKLVAIFQQKHEENAKGFASQLKAFADEIVPGVWVTDINITGGGKTMVLTGNAEDGKLLLQYVNNLNTDKALTGDKFKVSKIEKTADKKLYHFVVATTIDTEQED
tara:strand:- start:474 stop:1079 length:606 start_codon:yes stop_codon:yes gene_type:complete